MLRLRRQEQQREVVYDTDEQMRCPYFKKEMENAKHPEICIDPGENALQGDTLGAQCIYFIEVRLRGYTISACKHFLR